MTVALFLTAGPIVMKAWLLYAVVVLTAILSLAWKQELGLYALTVLLPLQTTRYHLHALPLGANIVDILLICSLIGAWLHPAEPLARKSAITPFLVVMGIFYYASVWRGAFFLNAPMPVWFNNLRLVDYKNFMVMPLLYFAVTAIIRTRRQIAIILVLACITACAVDFSYYKSTTGRDFAHYSEDVRDAGPLGYAGENGLAAYVVEFTGFLVAFMALKRHRIGRLLGALLLAANIACLLFSYSREAYIALAAAFCYIALFRMRWLLIPVAVVAIGWQAILPTAVQERMTMTYSASANSTDDKLDSSAQERVALWTDAMTLFKGDPIIGTGFLTYGEMGRVGPYRDTHNYYLKLLVETGAVGLTLFLIQLLLFFHAGYRLFRTSTDDFLSILGLGFSSLILCAAIVNIFGDRWMFIQVDSNLWILLGCVVSAYSLSAKSTRQTSPQPVEGDVFTIEPQDAAALTDAKAAWANVSGDDLKLTVS